jgi:3-oxoacyl-[acyl-carrier protein] reductase
MKKEPETKLNAIKVGMSETIDFSISAEMVASFCRLTGDQSSLHTNASFSRRSMYRETVVHGMLPVMFLSAVKFPSADKFQGSLEMLSARFLKPVFVGDLLRLIAEVVSIDETKKSVEISFRIFKSAASSYEVTAGIFKLHYRQSPLSMDFSDSGGSCPIPIIRDPLVENELSLQNINQNDEDGFRFWLLPEHSLALERTIQSGIALTWSGVRSVPAVTCDLRNFLAVSLLSTFIGMRRPGRLATFLEFSISFEREMVWREPHTLKAVVNFISQSTQTVVEKVFIQGAEGTGLVCAKGKTKAKVNEPSRMMPSLNELREKGLDFQLKDKVVLVTGASRGIGETTAKLFSLHGAKVAINYLTGESDANRVVQEITDNGGVAMAFQADVSCKDQVDTMVKAVSQSLGPVDILINNAVRDASAIKFLELTWKEIQRTVDVILQGAFNCCQAVIPEMIGKGGGKIINITTVYTEIPPQGQLKYAVAKSGLVGMTRSLAMEMAPHNIQVNMVSPSMVETDLAAGVPKMVQEKLKHETPMNRLATPLDVARAVVFLASSQASFTTGQRVMVTGGLPPFL